MTKTTLRFVVIPFVIIMTIWLVMGILTSTPPLPERYITPDYMCGQLSKIEIESIEMNSSAEVSIETTSGAVPDLPKVVNVYEYNHPGQSLLAVREMQKTAELLGFDPNSFSKISTTEYQWIDQSSHKTLVIETSNQNILMTTDFSNPSVDTLSASLPSTESAVEIARQYLSEVNLLTSAYDEGDSQAHLVQITPSGELREAPSLSEADLVRVDFFRTKSLITIDPELVGTEELGETLSEELAEEETTTIETEESSVEVKQYDTRIFNENPFFGNITVFVGGATGTYLNEYSIFGLEYRNWVLEALTCGTYKLISPQESVRLVQDGEASLAYLMEKGGDDIIPYEAKDVESLTILDVSLAYWEPAERQEFLQPIYVISGEANFGNNLYGSFFYFVPAIDYDSIPDNAGIPQPDTEEESTEESTDGSFF